MIKTLENWISLAHEAKVLHYCTEKEKVLGLKTLQFESFLKVFEVFIQKDIYLFFSTQMRKVRHENYFSCFLWYVCRFQSVCNKSSDSSHFSNFYLFHSFLIWFQIIFNDFKWFTMILKDFNWFSMFSNDFKLILLISYNFISIHVITSILLFW